VVFPCISRDSIYVDCADHVYRSLVADPLGSSRNDGIGRNDRAMGVPDDGFAELSSLSGSSSTWKVDCLWAISLGETSHVHESFVDNNGMDDRTTAAMADDLVGRAGGDAIGQTSV